MFLFTKWLIILTLSIQEYCPCKKGSCAPPPPKRHLTPLERDVQHDIDALGRGANEDISQDVNYIDHSFELETLVRHELENAMRDKGESFPQRLNEMCRVATDKLRRYDTIHKCLSEVKANPTVKAYVKGILMDDATYSCLQVADNEQQFNSCFIDYFSRNPQYLLRLANVKQTSGSPLGVATPFSERQQAGATRKEKIEDNVVPHDKARGKCAMVFKQPLTSPDAAIR